MILFEISREAFLPFLVASIIFGVIFGAVYDLFRIRRKALPVRSRAAEYILIFFEDVIFSLFVSVCLILLCYKTHFGIPRWYSYAGSALGFYLYRRTLGKIVMGLTEKLISLTKKGLLQLKKRLFMPVFRRLKTLFGRLFKALKEKIKRKDCYNEEERAP